MSATLGQPFFRDLYYLDRIEKDADDPFDIRLFDFPLERVYDSSEFKRLVLQSLGRCDSLSVRLSMADGALRANEDFSVWEDPQIVYGLKAYCSHEQSKATFVQQYWSAINLIYGSTFVVGFVPGAQNTQPILRLLTTHFAVDHVTKQIIGRRIKEEEHRQNSRDERVSYLGWMTEFHGYATGSWCQPEIYFWNKWLEKDEISYTSHVARACEGRSRTEAFFNITKDVANAVKTLTSQLKCKPFELYSLLFVSVIGEYFQIPCVPVMWTGHGRYPWFGRSYSRTTGWLSSRHPIIFPRVNAICEDAVIQFRHAFQKIPNMGGTFEWVKRFGCNERLNLEWPEHPSPFIFNVKEEWDESRRKLGDDRHNIIEIGGEPQLRSQRIMKSTKFRLAVEIRTGSTNCVSVDLMSNDPNLAGQLLRSFASLVLQFAV